MDNYNKDLLSLNHLNKGQILEILETAKTMKKIVNSNNKKTPHLQGKSIITLFYENSTRTRLSFELAAKYLGGVAANISASSSSVAKGETLIDTGRTIDVMGADIIIIRHPMSGAPHLLAKNIKASVINAGDGINEHPTQGLLDIFSIMEKKGKIEGLKISIVGDILHSRVARSNIYGLLKLGARVSISGPSTLIPPYIEQMGIKVFETVEGAIIDADVIMGLRIQNERQKNGFVPSPREYARFFGINDMRIKLAKDDVTLMHPGPVNRGVEFTTSVVEHSQSIIDEQVTNGVAIRMALLYMMTRRDKNEIIN